VRSGLWCVSTSELLSSNTGATAADEPDGFLWNAKLERTPRGLQCRGYHYSHHMSVKLESSDEQVFDVPREIAEMSVTVKHMLDDVDADSDAPIPLPNVTGKILAKVIEWAKYHHSNPDPPSDEKKDEKRTDDIIPWDKEFCDVDQPTLFELILAANYLDIKPLLDLTCKTVANMIKGKTPEEIRKTFNIKNDFTPEEEEQIRKENEWCMDL